MVESPNADTATAAAREIPPDTTELSLLPQPDKPLEPNAEVKPVPKTEKTAPPKPIKDAAPAKERRRIEAPTRDQPAKQAKASSPSTAANSVGIGRSDASTNYPGTVRAHLSRYQQSLGSNQGTAVVSFTLGGSGAVGGVRLARASGVAAIDQEVQAMVRRASPFPPPPAGAMRSFTIPINFTVR
jgi:protein TonB